MVVIGKKSINYINGQVLVSTGLLSELLNVSERRIQQWLKDGCPQFARGKWDLKQVLEWRGQVGVANTDNGDIGSLETKRYYETLLKKAQTEAAEFKNDVMSGKYLEKESVIAEFKRSLMTLKKTLLGLSRKIATEVRAYLDSTTARLLEKQISDIVLKALEQLSVTVTYDAKKE